MPMHTIGIEKAIALARKRCDWQDIDDMAVLVDGIENAEDLETELNLYRNGIAYIMNYRLTRPDGFDDVKLVKARRAIRDWMELWSN